MSTSIAYAATVNFDADRRIARWRPLVQLLLAVPHLVVANTLRSLRGILTLISAVSVVFTGRIPRPLFEAITMTYRYEWRAFSYIVFFQGDYPPFDFTPASQEDGRYPHATLAIAYPSELNRWKPLYKWFLAIPHYVICLALAVASVFTVLWAAAAVMTTGTYPERAQNFIVGAYRYCLRVETYVGALTDQYPPFRMTA